MPDWQVWSILLALGPVACLGGGLLGVLTGRWLGFPGAAAVVVVATGRDLHGRAAAAGLREHLASSGCGCRGRCSTPGSEPTAPRRC